MLMFVIQHRAGTDLGRELVACLLAHGSTFSRVGASGKPGAVQSADACCVHSVVALTLSTGGAHVDAASELVANDPDYDVICEKEPTTLMTCLDAARIDIEGNDDPTRHRFRNVKSLVERPPHGQCGHDWHHIGVGGLLHLSELRVPIP